MRIISIAFCSLLACTGVWAQSTAVSQISGTVQDANGNAVVGAEVGLRQTETGFTRTVVTGTEGNYKITNLPVGPYQLQVRKSGFSVHLHAGIVLQVNSNPVIDVVLQVGQVAETIEVQANAAMVETRSVGVGSIIMDLGRPDRALNVLRHPNFRSPLLWDVCSITIYLTASSIYLYLPLIPDLAILRDHGGKYTRQVQDRPRNAHFYGPRRRRKDPIFLFQPGHPVHVFGALLIDDIDDVVHGDQPEQTARAVDDGQREQLVLRELVLRATTGSRLLSKSPGVRAPVFRGPVF